MKTVKILSVVFIILAIILYNIFSFEYFKDINKLVNENLAKDSKLRIITYNLVCKEFPYSIGAKKAQSKMLQVQQYIKRTKNKSKSSVNLSDFSKKNINTVLQNTKKINNSRLFSGDWDLTFVIKKSDLLGYVKNHLQYKYHLHFTQKKNLVKASGFKYWEKYKGENKFYSEENRTPISIKGKIVGKKLIADVDEIGRRRKTYGTITINIAADAEKKYIGTFYTDAANSSGIAILEKANYFSSQGEEGSEKNNVNTRLLVGNWPWTSYRRVTYENIRNMSKADLRLMRNEIYARHGWVFKSPDLREYFMNQSWYKAIGDSEERDKLNKIVVKDMSELEKLNAAFIKKYE